MCSSPPEATSTERPSLAQQRVGGGRRQRLAGVDHLEVVGALARSARTYSARPGADVVLGVDVGGRAELGGQLDHVAARDLQVAALVHARARRIDRRGGDRVGRGRRPTPGCRLAAPSRASILTTSRARARAKRGRIARDNGAWSTPPPAPDREDTPRGARLRALAARPDGRRRPPRRARRDRCPTPPWPGIVICHGAGSRKENHADFARLAAANGWAALAFDARGHGASEGEMTPDAVEDVIAMAEPARGDERGRPAAGGGARVEHGRLHGDPRRRGGPARSPG